MAAELARKARSALNSALDEFGSVKVQDPVYQDAYNEVEEIATNVHELHNHLDQLYRCVEALSDAQKMVAQDMRKIYKGDPTAAEPVKDFIRSTRSLAVDLPGRMLPSLQKSVVGSSDKWSQRLQTLLADASGPLVTESYKKFSHYQEKVNTMTQEKRSGKLTSSAQKEAYSRNQDKLSGAKAEYGKIRDKVVQRMDTEAAVSLDEANKILLRVLQFTQAYFQQGAEAVTGLADARSTIDALVKNPPQRVRQVRQPAEDESDEDSGAESDGSEDVPRQSKGGHSKSGLSSSDDEEAPAAIKPSKKKSSRKSKPAEDSLMAFETQASAGQSHDALSPRTQEWQRKNDQRVLMGLPPKEHPAGPAYVQSKQAAPANVSQDPGMMLVTDNAMHQPQNNTDDLLASFGSLDMSAAPAPQAAPQQQPLNAGFSNQQFPQQAVNPFGQQQQFQQQQQQQFHQPQMVGGYNMQGQPGQMPAQPQYQGMQPMQSFGNGQLQAPPQQQQQQQQQQQPTPSPFQPFC